MLRGGRARGTTRLSSRPDPLPEWLRRPRSRPARPPDGDNPHLRARPEKGPRACPRAVRRTVGCSRGRGLRRLEGGAQGVGRAVGDRLPPEAARGDARGLAEEVGRKEPGGAAAPYIRRGRGLPAHRGCPADSRPQPPDGRRAPREGAPAHPLSIRVPRGPDTVDPLLLLRSA